MTDPALPHKVTVTAARVPAQSPYLTLKEVAERLRTTPDAIRMRINAGHIPGTAYIRPKGSRKILVRRSELEKLEAREWA